ELRVRAILRRFVRAPSTKLRRVTKARSLHVIVRDLHDELGAEWLPREVLVLAPAALRPRHALHTGPLFIGCRAPPLPPRVTGQGIFAVGRQEDREFAARLVRKARRNTDVVERALVVEEPKKK